MAGASSQAGGEAYGKASMMWLVGAYLLHTIGELCASPVALSFITKLAPVKYGAIMMGVYFAATGFGNKLAGTIGEASQAEAVEINLIASATDVQPFLEADTILAKDMDFILKADIYNENGKLVLMNNQSGGAKDFSSFIAFKDGAKEILDGMLVDEKASKADPKHAVIRLSKDIEAKKIKTNKGDGKNYEGTLEIFEVQNNREQKTFLFITALTVIFGLLIILFLKRLKALTHGAEEVEMDVDETEGFELADND